MAAFEHLSVVIPRLANFVESLSIEVPQYPDCESRGNRDRNHDMNCICSKKDNILEQIIIPLSNLKSLSIVCPLCDRDRRHSYLQSLKTTRLTDLSIRCFTCQKKSPNILQSFNASCMQTLVSLSYNGFEGRLSNSHLAIMKNNTYLPKLTTLASSNHRVFVPLLRRGTITRLLWDGHNSGLYVSL